MDQLMEGDEVLVRGRVTPRGVEMGGYTLPAADLDVVTDVPKFTGFAKALPLLLFFSDDIERQEFAESFRGLPNVEPRDV